MTDYVMRWKALIEMVKQQQDQADRSTKETREKREVEMEAARHERQVMLISSKSFGEWRSCITKRLRNRKQLELRQEEQHRRREKEMWHQKDSREPFLMPENKR